MVERTGVTQTEWSSIRTFPPPTHPPVSSVFVVTGVYLDKEVQERDPGEGPLERDERDRRKGKTVGIIVSKTTVRQDATLESKGPCQY